MPGGTICSVAICKSNAKKAKSVGEHLRFFTFPKDPRLRKEWTRLCYRKDKFNPDNKRICSQHFTNKDYEDALQAELLNVHPRKLKATAIPTLNLLPRETMVPNSSRRNRSIQKARKMYVENLLAETDLDSTTPNSLVTDVPPLEAALVTKESELENVRKQLAEVQNENLILHRQCMDQQKKENSLCDRISSLESELKKQNSTFEDQAKSVFKHIFTPNQVEIAIGKKCRARWTQDE